MKIENVHIGFSGLTSTIYCGTVSKKNPNRWNCKVDRTQEVLFAIKCLCEEGTEEVLIRGIKHKITVEQLEEEKSTDKPTITVWKNGTYKIWRLSDAHYAANDPDWLVNIELENMPSGSQ